MSLPVIREATLCFLLRGDPPEQVLLGYKKKGFGSGKFAGFGGKVEPGESSITAAQRELLEECGVRVKAGDCQLVGYLEFLFPFKPQWSQVVYTFLACRWEGAPHESNEMIPEWFDVQNIPYARMWQDTRYWLPLILEGRCIRARFSFADDNETVTKVEIDDWPY